MMSELPQNQFKEVSLFSHLDQITTNQLFFNADQITLNNRESLFEQGEDADCFYFIKSGVIKLSVYSNHTNTLLDLCGKGNLIGPLMMGSQQISKYPISAMSLGKSILIRIPKSTYNLYWMNNKSAMQIVHENSMQRMMMLQNDRSIQRLDLEAKVAYFLLSKVHANTETPITRRDIADGIGSSVESVIRVLSKWETNQWVMTQSQHIHIKNYDEIHHIWQHSK